MEWIVTEARTVADAKEVALDQLGVDEREAEFEILVEPHRGVLGLGRSNAQVRARVMPRVETPPERRGRPRRGRGGGTRAERADKARESSRGKPGGDGETSSKVTASPGPSTRNAAKDQQKNQQPGRRPAARNRSTQAKDRAEAKGRGETMRTDEPDTRETAADPANEEETVCSFARGLVEAFDLDAAVTANREKDGILEIVIDGEEVGLLIGHRGATLSAVEELLRVIVQRQAQGRRHSKVRLEVAGYRQRRKEALESFAQRVAEDVATTGSAKILEPMNSADRKIVHDAILEMEGVETVSEGEEPRRRVVVRPES